MEPREVVQAAIDACNDHDLDRCMSYCAPDVIVRDADGNVLLAGAEAVRAQYAKSMADNPGLHYDIPNRISLEAIVVDDERVTGFTAPGTRPELRQVLLYRFTGELIHEITVLS